MTCGRCLIATYPKTYTRFVLAVEAIEPYRFPLKDLKKMAVGFTDKKNLKKTQVLFLLNKKLFMKQGVVAHVCL